MKLYLMTATIIGLGLCGCSDVKTVGREIAHDRCSASEIAARVQELGADQIDSLDTHSSFDSYSNPQSMEEVNRSFDRMNRDMNKMNRESNRFMSAVSRINAAVMRRDLDTACQLLDKLEAEMKGN